MTIVRPDVTFDAKKHKYYLDGEELLGISTVAKIGGALDAFGVASAWGYNLGVEGAYEIRNLSQFETLKAFKDEMKRRGLTPWSKSKKAQDRGNYVHDVLEALATSGEVPDLDGIAGEEAGHARGVLKWYVEWQPSFVSTEVQVVSATHKFAGRYDIRARVKDVLCLIDLKTSKRVYEEQHFPQLMGYEIASVEMGFPPTEEQYVLNTHPDGTYDFVLSTAIEEDFLAFLAAAKSIRRMKGK